MARYELPIYGANDEQVKMYETNVCPWAVYIQAAEMQETLADKSAVEQINAVGELLMSVFIGLTKDELAHADALDVMSTFEQIYNSGTKIRGGSSKNANRARE